MLNITFFGFYLSFPILLHTAIQNQAVSLSLYPQQGHLMCCSTLHVTHSENLVELPAIIFQQCPFLMCSVSFSSLSLKPSPRLASSSFSISSPSLGNDDPTSCGLGLAYPPKAHGLKSWSSVVGAVSIVELGP